MGSGTGDKAEGKVDQVKGKAKQAFGDRDTRAEGKGDELKGKAKDAAGDVKNAGQKAKDGVKKALQ
jgi:uncharacterized protein YjbJ (UPF0337 family)